MMTDKANSTAEPPVTHTPTPAPWTVERIEYNRKEDVSFEIKSGRYLVAQTIMRDIASDSARIASDEANARLIAASPELLAAAKAALAYDIAIQRRGFIGKGLKKAPGLPGALAEGDDLDALYWDWQRKAAMAVAKVEGVQ